MNAPRLLSVSPLLLLRMGLVGLIWGWTMALTGLQAQTQAAPSLQIGLGWWGYNYLGDLSEGKNWGDRAYPGVKMSLQFEGRKALQLQFNVGYGRIVDQTDAPPVVQQESVSNTYVETPFFYTDLRLRWFFLRQRRWESYVGAGAGLLFFRPLDQFGNFLGENFFSRLPEEQYNTNVASFPLSLGFLIRINPVVKLGVEYTHFLTLTDYLDNISQLGNQAGNDRMQGLGVSIHLNLNPVRLEEDLQPPTPDPSVPALDPYAWRTAQEEDLLESWTPFLNGPPIWENQVMQHPLGLDPLLPLASWVAEQATDSSTWQQTVNTALARQEVQPLYLRTPLQQEDLVSILGISGTQLLRLNPQLPNPIPASYRLLLPDVYQK